MCEKYTKKKITILSTSGEVKVRDRCKKGRFYLCLGYGGSENHTYNSISLFFFLSVSVFGSSIHFVIAVLLYNFSFELLNLLLWPNNCRLFALVCVPYHLDSCMYMIQNLFISPISYVLLFCFRQSYYLRSCIVRKFTWLCRCCLPACFFSMRKRCNWCVRVKVFSVTFESTCSLSYDGDMQYPPTVNCIRQLQIPSSSIYPHKVYLWIDKFLSRKHKKEKIISSFI